MPQADTVRAHAAELFSLILDLSIPLLPQIVSRAKIGIHLDENGNEHRDEEGILDVKERPLR